MRYLPVLFALALVPAARAVVVPECQLRVLQPVTDDLGNHWQPGKVLPVDIERMSTGGGAFCASGGSCIPRKVNGADAVQLLNCRVGPAIDGEDYRLVPDARLAGAATAKAMPQRNQVDQKLSQLGFSNASAGSLAQETVDHPASAKSRLVQQALAGSQDALATLKRTDP